jgi:GT2 family glycosyltransferase
MKKVGIIVLNYKNFADTIECLQSLFLITYHNYEIVVVDNDSKNESLAAIAGALNTQGKEYARLDESTLNSGADVRATTILFQSPSNRGYAAGNNWGIKIALMRNAEYVLILNNDTVVQQGFLEPLVAFAEGDPRIGAVGPKIMKLDGTVDQCCARKRASYWEWVQRMSILSIFVPVKRKEALRFYRYEYAFNVPKKVDILSGSCMLLKAGTIQRVGLLDETTFLNLEEFILCEKLRQVKLDSYVVPESIILHKVGGAIKNETSGFLKRVTMESRRYYFRRYRKWGLLRREFLMFEIPNIQYFLMLRRRLMGRTR